MYPTSSLILFAAVVAAQSSTLTFYLPGFDNQTVYGSVIASDNSATTVALACPTAAIDATGTGSAAATATSDDDDSDECGIYPGMTITAGPAIAAYTVAVTEESFSASLSCSLSGSTGGVCAYSYGGEEANDPGQGTTTLQPSDYYGQLLVIQTNNLAALTAAPGIVTANGANSTVGGTAGSTSTASSGSSSRSGSSSGSIAAGATASTSSHASTSGTATGTSGSATGASASASASSTGAATAMGASIAGVGLVAGLAAFL